MALELVWTKRAAQGYDRIVRYLEKEWTEREVHNFVQDTDTFFELLRIYPEILEKTEARKHVYRGPINKHTILTYRIRPRKKQIELINIRGARQRPLKK